MEALLLAAAERTPGLGGRPAPFVLQQSLGDFAVVYELNVPCENASEIAVLYTGCTRTSWTSSTNTAIRS